jgi:hypothetical protein
MKNTILALAACLFLTGSAVAANRPSIQLDGNYVEARTADVYVGACFANSEVQLVGNLAVFGWKVNRGEWNGVKLDGLSVVAAVRAESTLGDQFHSAYPVKSYLILDEKATLEQRDALRRFAKRMSGDLLQEIIGEAALPIEFKVEGDSIHEARVSLAAGTLAAIRTRAIVSTDHVCAHEVTWYPPLTEVEHAMPAYALDHRFNGAADKDLRARWWNPDKRSAFVGTFRLSE